jgi:hypothetical protein
MPDIDWSRPVRTKHLPAMVGIAREIGITGRRRVALPSLSKGDKAHEHLTWFLYPDSGISRCDGQPSEYDLENYDPRDGVETLSLDERTLRGAL